MIELMSAGLYYFRALSLIFLSSFVFFFFLSFLKFCDKKKDGKFYREVRKKMVLLDPQPNETNLVEMKRYYAKLQSDPKYEKPISWFEKLPSYSPEVLSSGCWICGQISDQRKKSTQKLKKKKKKKKTGICELISCN